jgi:hypothetical protein
MGICQDLGLAQPQSTWKQWGEEKRLDCDSLQTNKQDDQFRADFHLP